MNKEGYINDRDGIVNWVIDDEWLNTEVEIIEEEKEIEKLPIDELYLTEAQQENIVLKINELIDEIKKLKESK